MRSTRIVSSGSFPLRLIRASRLFRVKPGQRWRNCVPVIAQNLRTFNVVLGDWRRTRVPTVTSTLILLDIYSTVLSVRLTSSRQISGHALVKPPTFSPPLSLSTSSLLLAPLLLRDDILEGGPLRRRRLSLAELFLHYRVVIWLEQQQQRDFRSRGESRDQRFTSATRLP